MIRQQPLIVRVKLSPGLGQRELPVDFDLLRLAFFKQGQDFPFELSLGGDAPVETLAGHGGKLNLNLNLNHVEPRSTLRSVGV